MSLSSLHEEYVLRGYNFTVTSSILYKLFLPFIYPILLKELICYSLIGQLLKENEQGNL